MGMMTTSYSVYVHRCSGTLLLNSGAVLGIGHEFHTSKVHKGQLWASSSLYLAMQVSNLALGLLSDKLAIAFYSYPIGVQGQSVQMKPN